MRPASLVNRSASIVNLCIALILASFASVAVAQTSPDQRTKVQTATAQSAPVEAPPPPVYVPTSLKTEPGLPRTPDGHPDLQGVVWNANFFSLLQANPLLPAKLVLSEAEAKAALDQAGAAFLSNPAMKTEVLLNPEADAFVKDTDGLPLVRGERRSRLLVLPTNGKLVFTPEILKEYGGLSALMSKQKFDNPEDRYSTERCINMALGGIPPVPANGFNPRQFIQTPNHIVIHTEYGGEVRIIPFTDKHGPGLLRSAMGDSIARWDGDTLEIETTSNPASERFRQSPVGGLFINTDAKVIERYTRVSKDELLYQYTVEDPKVFAAPWLAEYSLYRASFRMYESACHEGNYSLANTLSGAREQDRATGDWTKGVTATTTNPDRRWTPYTGGASVNLLSWAVLDPKDAAGEARVALRVEYAKPLPVDSVQALSETYDYAIDCAGQRLRRLSRTVFLAHNLIGEKHEQPTNAGWQAASVLPSIADGIVLACAGN